VDFSAAEGYSKPPIRDEPKRDIAGSTTPVACSTVLLVRSATCDDPQLAASAPEAPMLNFFGGNLADKSGSTATPNGPREVTAKKRFAADQPQA
jgi:hypothetical protein